MRLMIIGIAISAALIGAADHAQAAAAMRPDVGGSHRHWTFVPAQPVEPYGGCKETLQEYPAFLHTKGADMCRDRGWVLRRHFAIAPNKVLMWTDFAPCPTEDWYRCVWDAKAQGNHRGDSFVAAGPRHRYYVAITHPVQH